ncbi:MAG TPA: Rne/Rng family ribonuclease, partial [Acidimicrobiales bacterium]|nr:Rne/Rng family ribonuclease [Acidimicrobiales bacterium]
AGAAPPAPAAGSDPAEDAPAAPASPSRPASGGARAPRRRPAAGESPSAEGMPADDQPELPDRPGQGRPSPEAAARATVRRPRIGDTRPAPPGPAEEADAEPAGRPANGAAGSVPERSGGSVPERSGGSVPERSGGSVPERSGGSVPERTGGSVPERSGGSGSRRRRRRGGRGRGPTTAAPAIGGVVAKEDPVDLDEETLGRRRGRERKGRPVGRYLMCVHTRPGATQIAVLEGRALIEHYVARPADDATQIHGNIYLGKVQNVLPGMEAAFVDIGTPKNAVLYRGDVQYDPEDVEEKGGGGRGGRGGRGGEGKGPEGKAAARIEQLLRPGQTVLCQVTKNPIGTKGARLTQEVSLAGRFVVLLPGTNTYGISKRLPDDERRRLRRILDDVRTPDHGLIVRTAAEGATPEELRRDVQRLQRQWHEIDALAARSSAPALLYREPPLAVRVIREEFNKDYRGVQIDDPELYAEVRDYVSALIPELSDRVELYDDPDLPLFERQHVHEQLHKALDRKVWLPSGGSLIIERTEALTVIDVNTGKNVGSSSLEETVYRNNLEAAEEIAHQLRLRDIGGIIVIDFIDMEVRKNRDDVLRAFKEALARDKTRTQVFDISELGLVEMTRKRVSEGLVESFSTTCPTCAGRGFVLDDTLL